MKKFEINEKINENEFNVLMNALYFHYLNNKNYEFNVDQAKTAKKLFKKIFGFSLKEFTEINGLEY